MAVLINAHEIFLELGNTRILDGVTLGVHEGDRIGVVGINGGGKSSLVQLLSGTLEPTNGSVVARRDLTVGVLGQTDDLDDEMTVIRAVVGDVPEHEWARDKTTRIIIEMLLGEMDHSLVIKSLSGGQRRRVDLARVLIARWDVLFLDEPTNHLDIEAITWLAQHLNQRWSKGEGALVLITHDRWFLDEVAHQMWEVHDGAVDLFEGGYAAYVQKRAERDRLTDLHEEKRQNLVRKELAWLSRGAQARTSKPKFHLKQARELIAQDPPLRDERVLTRLAMSRLGKRVFDLEHARVEVGSCTVLSDETRIIGPGARIGIVGANGTGKTSLLNALAGSLEPTGGRIKRGQTVVLGYLTQRFEELAAYEQVTVREVLRDFKRFYQIGAEQKSATQILDELGLKDRHLKTRVCDLSGGQRRILQLALVLFGEPNVLLLDEPGNDLDTDMLVSLESMLDGWAGTLIVVSHDRYLLERVTDDQYALVDGHLHHLVGGVDEYLAIMTADKTTGDSAGTAVNSTGKQVGSNGEAKPQKLRGADAQARRELKKKIESTKRKLGTQQEKLAELLAAIKAVDPTDYAALHDALSAKDAKEGEVRALEDELLELVMEFEMTFGEPIEM